MILLYKKKNKMYSRKGIKMALDKLKTITLHVNDSNRKILEPIVEEAQAKGISLSAAVIDKLSAISKPLEDPIAEDAKAAQEIETDPEVEKPFDETVERAEAEAAEAETEEEIKAANTVETSDSPVTKITLDVTALSDEDEYYKVKIEREDGTSDTMEWLPEENADSDDNTEENVLQFISNNNISPETEIAVAALESDTNEDFDEEEDEDRVITRTTTLEHLDSKAVRKHIAFDEEEDEIYDDLKEILKTLKNLEKLREEYPMGQVAEVERDDDDDYDLYEDEDEDEDRDDDDWDEEEDEDEDYDEDEDEEEDEEYGYDGGQGRTYDDYL